MTKKLIISFGLAIGLLMSLASVGAYQVKAKTVPGEETEGVGVSMAADPAETTNQVRVNEVNEAGTDDKDKTREEIQERIREKAELAVENAIRRYEQVRTQVQNSNLSEEAKSSVLEKVDAQITAMNTLKNQIQVAQTTDEIKQVVTQLKTRFQFSLGVVRQAIQGVFEDRITNVSERLNSVYTKIEERVNALEDGDEKTDYLALLAEARIFIDAGDNYLAADDYSEAVTSYKSARENLQEIVEGLN